ncbi:MAG: hypothetical protein IJ688_03530 [Treponema sp.]|nr:hypothetical protein [Treponema sp.]
MQRKDKGTGKIKKTSEFIFEKNFRPNWLQRIARVLYLLFPIAAAFGGYFAAAPLWKLHSEKAPAPEIFRFIISILFLTLAIALVFFKTRNTNPIMKIRVLSKNSQNVNENTED